jgi:hypothetical protein
VRILAAVSGVVVGVAVLGGAPADAHRNPCHGSHTCPSDHHTYVGVSPAGKRLSCAEPSASEYEASRDRIRVVWDGLPYYCFAVGAVPKPKPAATGRLRIRPIRKLTPGSVITRVSKQFCRPGWASKHRHVTKAMRLRVAKRYGVRYTPKLYETDHLIPLELGGSNKITNLWPEPYRRTSGARRKDRLENTLHSLVCAGKLGAYTAQRAIAVNWIAAYAKYVPAS